MGPWCTNDVAKTAVAAAVAVHSGGSIVRMWTVCGSPLHIRPVRRDVVGRHPMCSADDGIRHLHPQKTFTPCTQAREKIIRKTKGKYAWIRAHNDRYSDNWQKFSFVCALRVYVSFSCWWFLHHTFRVILYLFCSYTCYTIDTDTNFPSIFSPLNNMYKLENLRYFLMYRICSRVRVQKKRNFTSHYTAQCTTSFFPYYNMHILQHWVSNHWYTWLFS